MATDATGAPTPLGIPTYNINVDAPSGNGNAAQMNAIDTLLQARATLASPALTGNPTAPTPLTADNDTSIATTAFVQAVVAQSAAATVAPTGTLVQFAGSTAPSGWLLADGSAVSRSTYATLFGVIGSTYGNGDGSTTFNVPDLRGRIAVGKNTATFAALGGTGGEETHALTIPELAPHTHTYTLPNTPSAIVGTNGGQNLGDAVRTVTAGTATGSTGSGTAHNNLQPYLVVNHIIKT